VVFWRLRYKLSLRDLPEMFLLRGIEFSHEAVRVWEAKLSPALIDHLRRLRGGRIGRSWYIDETYIKVHGRWCYLYRAIDRSGALVDVRLSEKRDMAAAKAFFRSARAVTGVTTARVTTDGHDSYPRAIRTTLGEKVKHRTNRYLNPIGLSRIIAGSRADTVRCGDLVTPPLRLAFVGLMMNSGISLTSAPAIARTPRPERAGVGTDYTSRHGAVVRAIRSPNHARYGEPPAQAGRAVAADLPSGKGGEASRASDSTPEAVAGQSRAGSTPGGVLFGRRFTGCPTAEP
jgi:hypothetical protein